MPDNLTPIPVKTKSAGDVVSKIVDSAGANQLNVDAGGRITAKISDGTDMLQIRSDGSIDVNIISGGGGSEAPTNPVVETLTHANLAAGATANLDTGIVSAGTKKLRQIIVSASVPIKARVGPWNGTTFSPRFVIFVMANSNGIWQTPHPNYITFSFDGTDDRWRVEITNMDNANAADVYATVLYEG